MAAPPKKKKPLLKRIRNKLKSRLKKIVKYVGYKWVLPSVYKWYARKPIDEKLVVFADFWDRDMPDNFRGLYRMCQQNGFRCVVLSGRPFANSVPKWQRRKEKLKFQFQFIKLFAQCKVLFLVELFNLSDIVKKRPETLVIQLWHGCGLMKKWGYATINARWGASEKELKRYPAYVNQTLSTVSSYDPIVKEGYLAAFHCDSSIVKPLGCPRTDIYFNNTFVMERKEKIRSLFPQIGNRRIVLYAPTFRGNSIPKSYIKYELNFSQLKKELAEEFVLITKFHPQMVKPGLSESNRIQGLNFVFDVTNLLSVEEILPTADVLITDYSSILFEFLLFERPIISYIFDIDQYEKDRGLFLPYDQLAPGPYVFTQEELVEKLRTVDQWFDIEKTRQYKEKFMSACDGHSTERIFQYVFEKEPANDIENQ